MSSRYSPPKDLSRYAWLSIGAALGTIALKGAAAWLTGSVGLLSDAAESVVNLVAAVVALIVLKIAARPADADHQFGHSKAEYFSAVVEGVMIFVAAAFIIISAIGRLIDPQMPEQLGLGLVVSVIASLLNGAVAWVLYRAGRRERSMTLVADAKHLATDVITSAAVLVGWPWWPSSTRRYSTPSSPWGPGSTSCGPVSRSSGTRWAGSWTSPRPPRCFRGSRRCWRVTAAKA
ncbi:cation diffusion facilitator family transporter domain protein [Actinomyces naeslundii str. Howell 279]|uniref:Cation diffusion facilitator family transporter domain protein n=1 Tax=Actinomyces naeslundii (strain ATCC 12104 / DSM 43013 / CCUG 2238 / JCM 8349 / NCTC 10301 / Howell 279) TaxID=1115803 RepID=J3F5G7_ACTNH|nr:cation diffusion facilitator family transporter domain protein [Actinomyces naeslundii str. Howell 279]